MLPAAVQFLGGHELLIFFSSSIVFFGIGNHKLVKADNLSEKASIRKLYT